MHDSTLLDEVNVLLDVDPGGLKLYQNIVRDELRKLAVTSRDLAGLIMNMIEHILHAVLACEMFTLGERQSNRLGGLV